jgi:hypothetical protein
MPKIIQSDSTGYNPKKMKPSEYFGNIENNKIEIAEFKDEAQTDTTRELKEINIDIKENKDFLQLKENAVGGENKTTKNTNDVKVNNFIEMDVKTCKEEKEKSRNLAKTKIISFEDYRALDPDDLDYDRRTFMQCFKDLLIENHSIISLLFKRSLFEPCFMRYMKLLFELNMQFAFCAMLFTDSYIEKRLTRQITVN